MQREQNRNMSNFVKKQQKKRSEYDVQCEIVTFLRQNLKPLALFTSFPAGGGGRIRGAKLKKSGLARGWPDLQIVYKGKYYGLEVKNDKGVVSDCQKELHKQLIKQGAKVRVVKSVFDVEVAINDWHLSR